MTQEYIEIKGARENNLKNVSVRIPKRQITIFTGVSGSGKSSIVFGTVATESQRQLNETHSAFVRGFLPKYREPDTDGIRGLGASIIIDQKRIGGNSRSTLGTITDINPLFRVLFSRIGQPEAGPASSFSFNDPSGMCPDCQGVGRKITLNLEKFLDYSKSLNEGAIQFSNFSVGSWYWNIYALSGYFDLDKKLEDYSAEEMEKLLNGKTEKFVLETAGGPINSTYEGLIQKFDRLYLKKEGEMGERTKKQVDAFTTEVACDACGGARLSKKVLDCRINGLNIADYMAMQLDEVVENIAKIDNPYAEAMKASIDERVSHLIDIGLDYVTLDRETSTLSGGESQRVKMVRHLNSSLTDMIYIFDEPSIGLHPRDVHRLNELLEKLRDKGNTVLVVEHDPDVIRIADYIIDIGPKAGKHGGEVTFHGTYEELLKSDTLTGNFMGHHESLKSEVRTPRSFLPVKKTNLHNVRDLDLEIPTGVLNVITGVAGSGKSTIINGIFRKQYPDAIVIDQSAAHANSRSNPATYSGIMDSIRKLFGTANDVSPSLFSYNSKGACPECKGLGYIAMDMAFMDAIRTPCEACSGKRFKEEVLQYKLNGQTISDCLEMTVTDALQFFELKKITKQLQAMEDVGIGYLTLGQALSTLSGGECQRLKLATELHKKGSVYIMDEPTTGLHMSDTKHIVEIMNRLVDAGNTVIVIEHNLDIIRQADWIIDVGPEGGSKGGRILFGGKPADLKAVPDSITAKFI
ncbi:MULTISPECIES: excinuclease ABC subunit UvrA [Listeria]|uniref:ATP-binding cassette domain-containing protein n=1 Tax=Listeria TaxID=1637 RepID=UPI000B58B600|nr:MULTISPECIES: excinuclease ABC subunit UvrA [Listeria]